MTSHGAPARERDINVGRIQLKPAEQTAGTFSRDQRRSRAEESVEYHVSASGHVLNGISYHCEAPVPRVAMI